MLKSLRVKNFKGWETLDISLGQVTGLFGTNSSGKSSILQFLLLLKHTKNATDRGLVLDFGGPDQIVNLGSFKDAIHAHGDEKKLSWTLAWQTREKVELKDTASKRTDVVVAGDEIEIETVAHLSKRGLVCDSLEYRLGAYSFAIRPKGESTTEFQLSAKPPAGSDFRFVRNQARAWALPGPIKTHLFPDQAKTYYQNSEFLGVLESEYETQMNSIYYLGPLREYPKREYAWSGASPTDVGKRGERTIEAILAATGKNEQRNRGGRTRYVPFQQMVAYWLKELGLISEFAVEEIGKGANLYRAVVKRDHLSASALLTDVGFGVSQVLPALVLLYYVPEGSTVVLEQPEIHLHPAVQSGLADVILNAAQSRSLQVIVESHSEHLLRRLQRRVADETVKPEQIKLYFCASEDGRSALLPLNLDMFGKISNWPKNFFGDELGEIAETRKAELKRKIAITD